MVGINLNGVVKGRELKAVAGEIFNKAKSRNSYLKTETTAQEVKENPFSGFMPLEEFVPESTKNSKKAMEQGSVQIDSNLQKNVNSQAAINLYSKFGVKKQKKSAELFANKVSKEGFEINSTSKDKEGKNPFAFLAAATQDEKKPLNEEQLRSIFEALK